MYYEPNARVTIGNVIFNQVSRVVISESVKELGDKAIITLPRNYKLLKDNSVLDYIQSGNAVIIELGTNGNYYTEFTGYVDIIEADAPLVIHVDDEFYPLKRNSFKKTWGAVTLKELLKYVASNYTIDCADVNLGQFEINGSSSYRVLKQIVEQYGFYAKIIEAENTLKCYWPYDFRTGIDHVYYIGKNTKAGGNNLKYHRAEDVKLRVKGIANQRNGTKIVYETGSQDTDATLRTRNYKSITKAELIENVEKDYKMFAFNGYSGSIKGFALPRTHAGDNLKIINNAVQDMEGKYLIEKTIIRYDLRSGFERENTLSYKV